jgi:hypothetical protein
MESLLGNKILWLYAGIFNGWWLYTSENNKKLNDIYHDYCISNNIHVDSNDMYTDIYSDTDDNNTYIIENNIVVNKTHVIDIVSFDNIENDIVVNKTHTNINKINDYIINTCQGQFRIDMKNMKQINVSNPSKQRKIFFLNIQKDISINKEKLTTFLKLNKVKGIAGENF